MTPVRVGLTPTRSMVTAAPGVIAAATRKKAAEEISPGTSTRQARGRCPPRSLTEANPPALSRPSAIPKPRSMRSVWSRQGPGSRTVVSPSAYSPASSRQDLTWALATGMAWSIPRSRPGPMRSGGVPPFVVAMAAPMAASGSAMRRIGRAESDASPRSSLAKPCPASTPASRRMAVPELPRYRGLRGARRPAAPAP